MLVVFVAIGLGWTHTVKLIDDKHSGSLSRPASVRRTRFYNLVDS